MQTKEIIRTLRKNQTQAENILWQAIRNRKINNFRFIRQYPISFNYENQQRLFVLDFYCCKLKLGIEVDGSIHELQKEYDEFREEIIKESSIKIIRFSNNEIEDNLSSVLNKIKLLTDNK
jgi:very-short-patch-repair endonuclease